MTEDASEQSATAKWLERHPRIHAFLRHPASVLVWFTLFSMAVKEQYPFSHFPMYSGFASETWYVYLKTADDQPIRTKYVFKETPSHCKKRFGSLQGAYLDKTGKEWDDLTDEDRAIIGADLIKELKEDAPEKMRRKRKLENIFHGPVTLVWVDIRYLDGKFEVKERDIATY